MVTPRVTVGAMNLSPMAAVPASIVIGTIAFAPLLRRLTGGRVRFLRYAVAIVVGLLTVRAIADTGSGFTLGQLGIAMVLAFFLVVLAEALVPSSAAGGFLRWVRSFHLRLVCLRRYLQIGAIASRHVVSAFFFSRRLTADVSSGRTRRARSLRMAIEQSGVAFVKLGQLPSVRNHLLLEEYIVELNRLQYQVTPAPWPEVEALLAAELGGPPESVFAEFDPVPLAAASIAQVHRARLHTGAEVAVKIQRPGIRPVIERDLRIIRNIARMLQLRTQFGRSMRTVELADGFAAALHDELDFLIEARNMVTIGANESRSGSSLRVPHQHEELCTRRVIVMELFDGVPLAAAEPIIAERGLDRAELARTLLHCLLRQLMFDGVFHVDPHPGNVFLLKCDKLGLIDFGCVGRLGRVARTDLSRLFLAVEKADAAALRSAMLKCLTTTEELDEQRLTADLEQFLDRHFRSGLPVEPQVFTDLLRIATRHGLSPSCEFAAVFRALITMCDTINQLAPDFDIFAEARTFATGNLRWLVGIDTIRQAGGTLLTILPELWRVPANIGRLATVAVQGRPERTIAATAERSARGPGAQREQQVAAVLLLVAAGILGVVVFGGSGLALGITVDLFYVLVYALLAITVALMLRLLVAMFRQPRRARVSDE